MAEQATGGALRAMRMTCAELFETVRYCAEGRRQEGEADLKEFVFYHQLSAETRLPLHLAFLAPLAGNPPLFIRFRYHPWAWRIHAERLPGERWQYVESGAEFLEGDFVGARWDGRLGWTGAILRLDGGREVFIPDPCVALVGVKYRDLIDEREAGEPAFEN